MRPPSERTINPVLALKSLSFFPQITTQSYYSVLAIRCDFVRVGQGQKIVHVPALSGCCLHVDNRARRVGLRAVDGNVRYLHTAMAFYREAGLSDESSRVRIGIQKKIGEARSQMKPVSVETKISKDGSLPRRHHRR
jgi:hypothetical protein